MSKQINNKSSKYNEIPVIGKCWKKGQYVPVVAEDLSCFELKHFDLGSGHILGWVGSSEQMSTNSKFKKGQVLFGKLRPYSSTQPCFAGCQCSHHRQSNMKIKTSFPINLKHLFIM